MLALRNSYGIKIIILDIFSSSVISLEGRNHALVITDDCSGTDGCMVLRPRTTHSKLYKSGTMTLRNSKSVSVTMCAWSYKIMRKRKSLVKSLNSVNIFLNNKRNQEPLQHFA